MYLTGITVRHQASSSTISMVVPYAIVTAEYCNESCATVRLNSLKVSINISILIGVVSNVLKAVIAVLHF